MKNDTARQFANKVPFTEKALQALITKGFRYVQVKGYTWERESDYMEPHCFMLVPLKDLPTEDENRDIYEPLNSQMLRSWAGDSYINAGVFVAMGNN
jgi:hypothetical protein